MRLLCLASATVLRITKLITTFTRILTNMATCGNHQAEPPKKKNPGLSNVTSLRELKAMLHS